MIACGEKREKKLFACGRLDYLASGKKDVLASQKGVCGKADNYTCLWKK